MVEANITQIPVAGSSGRVPTGALQFRDDWPGLFLRGDDAIGVMVSIRHLAERLRDSPDVGVASALSRLKRVADIIERDVVVHRARGFYQPAEVKPPLTEIPPE